MNFDLHQLWLNRSLGRATAILTGGAGQRKNAATAMSRSPSHGNYVGTGAAAVLAAEVNRKDALGRTVLHLAVSETDSACVAWVELLLATPGVQVNAVDEESGWTALHRALYAGNLAAARALLARDDTDPKLKDNEGLTAFDVYNSTVEGTNPAEASSSSNPPRSELFTWGSNRNFVLGFPSDADRAFPERVPLKREGSERGLGVHEPVRVREVAMARLHSAIVTDERPNLRLCGYGTAGRLGGKKENQFTFEPLSTFPFDAKHVLLSPDHSLVISTTGDVWTFGLNRFSQLGYVIDAPPVTVNGRTSEEPIQSVPKRVVGALKKEFVLGGAVSRTHSIVFTSDGLYSWGTNRGQLGYALAGGAVQILPRKVTAVDTPVIAITATENASACLLASKDVLVLYKDGYVKVVFSLARFPSRMQTYRPPQVSAKPNIEKIASCGNTFAALSSLGDVFSFVLDGSSENQSQSGHQSPKTSRIWSLRRKFTAVTDVAVGQDGTILLSTVSGHVYIRSRRDGGKRSGDSSQTGGWKVMRVPYLQRIVKVAASSTGAFAALRSDVPLRMIDIEGITLPAALVKILPHWRRISALPPASYPSKDAGKKGKGSVRRDEYDDDDGEVDATIERDVQTALRLFEISQQWDDTWETSLGGSDVHLETLMGTQSIRIPCHRLVLAARSPVLAKKFSSPVTTKTALPHCSQALTALLLMHYLYSDDLPSIWDTRVGQRLRDTLPSSVKIDFAKVKEELVELSTTLELPALRRSLVYHVKTSPEPVLTQILGQVFHSAASPHLPPPDVVLVLADREVLCHSVVLRARCAFFETFFEDPDWSLQRREAGTGRMRFDLQHLSRDVMALVLEHVYKDAGVEMFDLLEQPSADDYIDFVTRILAASNELMLDKLKLVCSAVLRSFVTLYNVASILTDACFYEAPDLARTCMHFLASSMETVLEARLLDDLSPDLVAALSTSVQEKQGSRMPISRSGFLVNELLDKHAGWLLELDYGRPTGGARKFKPVTLTSARSPLLSPSTSPVLRPKAFASPLLSPMLQPLREDAPFEMDDFSLDSSTLMGRSSVASTSGSATPARSTPMRAAASGFTPGTSPSSSSFMTLGSPPPARLQPWVKAESSKAPLDLRSIMASENMSTSRKPRISIDGPSSSQTSSVAPSPTHRPSPQTWRAPEQATSQNFSLANIQSEQLAAASTSKLQSLLSRQATPFTPSFSPPVPVASTSTSPSPRAHVITPVRMPQRNGSGTPASTGSRTPRSNNATFAGGDVPWTNYIVAPPAPSPPTPSFPSSFPDASAASPKLGSPAARSFLSIQSQQSAEILAIKTIKAPRSFTSVIAAEKAAAEAVALELAERNEEIEFAKWWDEEAARVADEMNSFRRSEAALNEAAAAGAGRGRGSKKKRGGGTGRGGAASGQTAGQAGGESTRGGARGGRGRGRGA